MKKLLVLLLLLQISVQSNAQILLDKNSDELSIHDDCWGIKDHNDDLDIEEVIGGDWVKMENGPMVGYTKTYEWMKVEVENPTQEDLERFFYVPYNHIKEIVFYVVKDNKVIKKETQGTSRSYSMKPVEARGYPFLFEVGAGEKVQLIARFDHRMLPLRPTSWIVTKEMLVNEASETELLIAFWRGIYLFVIIIALMLYLTLRRKVFLWYFLFDISFLVFLGTEIGDYFYFFDIDYNNYISDIKHVANWFTIAFVVAFMNELSGVSRISPKYWKFLNWLGIPLAVMILLGMIPSLKDSAFYFATDVYMLSWAMFFLISVLVMLVPASIKGYKNALALLIAYGVYIGMLCIDVILPDIGLATEKPNVHRNLLLGSLFEIFTFLILLGREAFSVFKERAKLLERQKFHQKEMLEAIVESQEIERNRVGRELHDLVGANMSIIGRNLNTEDENLKKLIDGTIESVRNLSHGLVTPMVEKDAFVDEVLELCKLNSSRVQKYYPYFHEWKGIDDKETTTHLYRIIQELVNNASKHSEANNVHIQLVQEDGKISLFYEDDGIGMKQERNLKKGVGLKGIEHRVRLLKGSLVMGAPYKGTGFTVTIEFPIRGN